MSNECRDERTLEQRRVSSCHEGEKEKNGDAERGREEGHWDRSDESTKRAHRA